MAEAKPLGIIYLEPNRLLFYSEALKQVLEQDFPPDTVSDLEILNKEKFAQVLLFFIQNSLAKQTFDLVLVFSTQMCFEKALVPTISKDLETLSSEFVSIVPFEEILSRVYKENKRVNIVAVNKTLYEQLAETFSRSGSRISLVLPLSIILERSPDLSQKMDLAALSGKVESLKGYNMIDYSARPSQPESEVAKGVKKNMRLYVLAGVFVILLLFMLAYGYSTFFSKPKTQKTVPLPRAVPTQQRENITQPSPVLSPSAQNPSSSSSPKL